ncbi:hypothetical protein SDC9_197464 [bioreactor metagenome]|jgi:hypothetical protein|uniref:Uncharacterized protein n=1 Tax=bioreactor metagenome TaxID=1076179 RepID=A0A645IEU7_9ZZZZ
MLCFHSARLVSGQLLSEKDGAAFSFDMSPEKTNVCDWPLVLPDVLELALEAEPLWRSIFQGMGTSLSPVLDEALGLEPLIALESRLITAKSALPDVGFNTTSSIVPIFWP